MLNIAVAIAVTYSTPAATFGEYMSLTKQKESRSNANNSFNHLSLHWIIYQDCVSCNQNAGE